jgi:hypothetical protein
LGEEEDADEEGEETLEGESGWLDGLFDPWWSLVVEVARLVLLAKRRLSRFDRCPDIVLAAGCWVQSAVINMAMYCR